MRTNAWILVGALAVVTSYALAHDVVWTENPPPPNNAGNPLVVVDGSISRYVFVQPEAGESCTVFVNLVPSSSTLVDAIVVSSPAVTVAIQIAALRAPLGGSETATIAGEWHMTGLPLGGNCTAVSPHTFTVPVIVRGAPFAQQPNAITIRGGISTSTGGVREHFVDLSEGGPFPVEFARKYDSQFNASRIKSALGSNWMHNYDAELEMFGGVATVTVFPGTAAQFMEANGTWELIPGQEATCPNCQFVPSGANYQFVKPAENRIYTFDLNRKLASIGDRNGNGVTVTQGAAGPLGVGDGLGRIFTLNYANNLLTGVFDQGGRSVTFLHTGGDLSGVTDANGKTTHYAYASGSLPAVLALVQRPLGNQLLRQYDSGGRATAQTDSFNNKTMITYDQPVIGARRIVDPAAGVTVHLYDGPGNLSQFTDPLGQNTLFDYDLSDRLTRVTTPLGFQTVFTYDPLSFYLASNTDGVGNTTTYMWAPQTQGASTFFNLAGITNPGGAYTTFTYDERGNLTGVTGPSGSPSTYTYNSRGQRLTATNSFGGFVSYGYGGNGNLASVIGLAGDVTAFTYDGFDRRTKETYDDGTSRSWTHDLLSRPLTRIDERGSVTRYAYDDNGNLVNVTDPLNNKVTIGYDLRDRVNAVTNPLGGTTHHFYDSRGNLGATIDPVGDPRTYTYDGFDRPIGVKDSSGTGPSVTYDEDGNVVTVADALANTTRRFYDGIGRLTRAISPKDETTSVTYDWASRITTSTDALGQTTSYTYGYGVSPISVSFPGGITVRFALDQFTDPNGNVWTRQHDAAGRLTEDMDPLGRAITYAYGLRNRVQMVTTPEYTEAITYDPVGNVTGRNYSDGLNLTMTWDANNRPTVGTGFAFAWNANGDMTSSNGLAIAYDAARRIAIVAFAPTKTVNYVHNQRGLVESVSGFAGGSVLISYDAARRPTEFARGNGVDTRYTYDEDGRLTSIEEARGPTIIASTTLVYDPNGRVVSTVRTGPPEPAPADGIRKESYDVASQLLRDVYDGLGRVTTDATRTYEWDAASRLKGYASSTESVMFTYDAFDNRTSRTPLGGSTETYVLNYALTRPSVSIVRFGSLDLRYYVHLPDGTPLWWIDAGTNALHYFHYDWEGSTRLLTDEAGIVTDTYASTPYGETVTKTGSTPNPYTWKAKQGARQEGNSSLFYIDGRYYEAALGRLLSRKPFQDHEPLAFNRYQYAKGDPLNHGGPFGLHDGGFGDGFGHKATVFLGHSGAGYSNWEREWAPGKTVDIGESLRSGFLLGSSSHKDFYRPYCAESFDGAGRRGDLSGALGSGLDVPLVKVATPRLFTTLRPSASEVIDRFLNIDRRPRDGVLTIFLTPRILRE